MNIVEIIEKKKEKKSLSYEELKFAFNGYLNKEVEDYQMSALLMAICINGMSIEEIIDLTDIFINSGNTYNLSEVFSNTVDKHSTGGVGDTTTLIVGPIVAALGLKMGKMSGRGLGLTGGTIDKLESIPGIKLESTKDEFISSISKVGFAISSQTDELTPLDKVIYALRDVTGTTKSIPLIVSSIISKKIALGAESILIDVKYGNGALIPDMESVVEFNNIASKLGEHFGKKIRTVASSMDTPLSDAIGNSIEILEVIDVLKGKKCPLLTKSLEISAHLLSMSKGINYEEALYECNKVVNNGEAFEKFKEFVLNQGGDINKIEVSNKFIRVKSKKDGIITKIDANGVAKLSLLLGSGRIKKDDEIDYSVGVMLNKRVGDKVLQDETILYMYVNDKEINYSEEMFDFIEID